MKELTKAEEQVMQILWKLGEGFVNDILDEMPNPKPAYNTVSTIVRILESKGIVDHKAFGKSYQYFPLVTKEEYTRRYLKNFLQNYFSNSYKKMVSFFSKNEDLSVNEIEEIIDLLKDKIEKEK